MEHLLVQLADTNHCLALRKKKEPPTEVLSA
jgi:hypothetical protein